MEINAKYLILSLLLVWLIILLLIGPPPAYGYEIQADRTGSHGFTISCTNSMYPTLTCDDNVTLQFVGYDHNFSVGDIVIYAPTVTQRWNARQNGFWITTTYLIHRIVGKRDNGYVLKGDNNLYNDNDFYCEEMSYNCEGIVEDWQIRYKVTNLTSHEPAPIVITNYNLTVSNFTFYSYPVLKERIA